MRDIIVNVEFKDNTNSFQQKLAKEKETIEKESKMIVGADKTSNFYKPINVLCMNTLPFEVCTFGKDTKLSLYYIMSRAVLN